MRGWALVAARGEVWSRQQSTSQARRAATRANTSHLSQKGGKPRQESSNLAYYQKAKKTKELSMYRLREMDVDDKVCEQVSLTMLSDVYPAEVVEGCVQQSEPWSTK